MKGRLSLTEGGLLLSKVEATGTGEGDVYGETGDRWYAHGTLRMKKGLEEGP